LVRQLSCTNWRCALLPRMAILLVVADDALIDMTSNRICIINGE
jgi:hypothetical protein